MEKQLEYRLHDNFEKAIENFNFTQVQEVMEFLNWKWWNVGVSSKIDMLDNLNYLFSSAIKYFPENNYISSCASGGFKVTLWDSGSVEISFILANSREEVSENNVEDEEEHFCDNGTVEKHKNKNPYIPKEIHVNEELRIVVVKWDDDSETKVTCDYEDTFNVDAGFAQALKYKIFGGKTEYKEKWWNIIRRRVRQHGNQGFVTPKTISIPVVPCFSCGTDCDPDSDYCYGCKNVVCVDCAEKYNHGKSGKHEHK